MISTLCGIGRAVPKGAGTLGSLVAVVASVFLPTPVRVGAIVVLTGLGIWAATEYEKLSGRTDPGEVIIDEVVGMLIATLWHIAGTGTSDTTARFAIPCFMLFRFFDILKPWPINACEKLPGGIGIMLDDIVGGIFACLLLVAFRMYFMGGAF